MPDQTSKYTPEQIRQAWQALVGVLQPVVESLGQAIQTLGDTYIEPRGVSSIAEQNQAVESEPDDDWSDTKEFRQYVAAAAEQSPRPHKFDGPDDQPECNRCGRDWDAGVHDIRVAEQPPHPAWYPTENSYASEEPCRQPEAEQSPPRPEWLPDDFKARVRLIVDNWKCVLEVFDVGAPIEKLVTASYDEWLGGGKKGTTTYWIGEATRLAAERDAVIQTLDAEVVNRSRIQAERDKAIQERDEQTGCICISGGGE